MSEERADRPADPELRASDAERDVVATRLREAHAEGRLSVAEFSERLDAALTARTRGDLEALTRDLPAAAGPARRRPRTGDEAAPARRARPAPTGLQAAWGVWVLAVLVNLVVWGAVSLADGGPVYFWPAWVAGPWGAVLLVRTLAGGRARGPA
jgi:hypothetical protein